MPATKKRTTGAPRKPSAFDVAREAGVSQTTVSFVMNGRDEQGVSEETRIRVLSAVQKLGYRPNRLARGLAFGRTQTIGVLLPFLNSDFVSQLVEGLRLALEKNGYRLLIVYTGNQAETEIELIEFCLQHRVDGLICFRSPKRETMPRWLQTIETERVPAIMIDDLTYCDQIDCVASDDLAGMDAAVRHLYDLGHRRIALVTSDWTISPSQDRTAGYEQAIKRLGLNYDVRIETLHNQDKEDVAREMDTLLESPQPPTAFVAINDYMLEAFLASRAHRRYRIPADVALVGYGNNNMCRLFKLTSVDQHPLLMGQRAGERLLERIRKPSMPVEKIITPTDVVVRASTCEKIPQSEQQNKNGE